MCSTHPDEESDDMLPALLSPAVLAALPTGPGAAVALLAVALSYAIAQREIEGAFSIR